VQQVGTEVTSVREVALAGRKQVRAPYDEMPNGFHAEGVLRTSAIFDSTPGPVRYRLVAAGPEPVRTLGYVEVTPESGIQVDGLIGQHVGVRASEVYYTSGDVDPIKIFVASELVPMGGQTWPDTANQPSVPSLPMRPVSAPPAVTTPVSTPAASSHRQSMPTSTESIPTLPVETLNAQPLPAKSLPAPSTPKPAPKPIADQAEPVQTAPVKEIPPAEKAASAPVVTRPTKKSSTDPDVLIIETKSPK
jgi:hypothetical protein